MKNNEIEILLVEDNTGDAELTIRALRKSNMANKLVHLENGADALDYIFAEGIYAHRNMDNLPRVILLDLNMPKINGIEVLQKIKSDERTKKIPVVVLTSSKEDPDIERCYELGVNSYIVKPVEFEKFMKAVGELGLYWLLLNQSPPL
ncbi:MAG: response regulator [Bacteroidota bacterium]|nr:response regulator [Bacteroidota bacterium]